MSASQLRSTPTFTILYTAALLVLASAFLLTGCSESYTPTATPAVKRTGNWQLASSAPAASKLPTLSGEVTGTSAGENGTGGTLIKQ